MKEITPSSHGSSSNTVISSAFYLSHQLLTTVKRLIRVCSVQPSTGETCYFTECPSEVPKDALPGALALIFFLQECKVSECPCLRSLLAFAIQEPLTCLNDVGWLCNMDCCSLGRWREAVKDFLRTVGCTVLEVEVCKVNGAFCL